MEHLTSEAASWLEKPIPERINALKKDKWIGHTQVKLILNYLHELHHQPPLDLEAKNLLIVGAPGSGKTAVMHHYAKAYQPSIKGHTPSWPILFIQLADGPKEGMMYEALLDSLQSAYAPRATIKAKRFQVINVIRSSNVKLLFIDEIHHLLLGSAMQQRNFLASLKTLITELDIPVVCAGVESAHNAICLDEQVGRRFEVARLPTWSMDQEYVRLLASFERVLALKKASNLVEPAMAFKLLELSKGSIGRLSRLLKKAAIEAVRTGTECITLPLLQSMHYFPLADEN